ncbi:MAG: toprim domain-containing protein [Candidatus Peribacteraceae bacterium]|nr:toprim domain-containing protein [Candidatus Peribacteraceae bacterium]
MSKRNRPCPKCREAGRDSKGDHLFLLSDDETWFCNRPYHSDGKAYREKDGVEVTVSMETKTSSSIETKETGGVKMNISEVAKLPTGPLRKLPKEVCDKFKCRVEHSESDGSIVKHFYPRTSKGKVFGYKIRKLPKSFSCMDSSKDKADLFGRLAFPYTPKILIITEGELDAMAAYEMTKGKYDKMMCTSLPNGVNSSAKALEDNRELIESATTILICPDQDVAGEEFIKAATAMYPKAKVMSFSEKDAYDMYDSGKSLEFLDAIANAKIHRLACVVSSDDVASKALIAPAYGLSYPFDGLTKSTFGLRTGRVVGIGAGPGAGKSTFLKSIQHHIIKEHRIPIGLFPLEEDASDVVRELAGFVMNKPLHLPSCKPGVDYDPAVLKSVIDSFTGLVHIYKADNYSGWKDIEATIRYMASMSVKFIFIDPLSALTAHLSASDANQYLGEACWAMKNLASSLGITIFHVNHLNNPSKGSKDHASGGAVFASQFTGSRAIWRFSSDLWGLARDQYAEDPNVRDIANVRSLKYRKPSLPMSFDLRYDPGTGALIEIPKGVSVF